MTWALCLNCGEVKFGAICPCPKCEVASTGDMNLDIAFSDHNLSKETLKNLGEVVAAIHSQSDDAEICFWTFIRYIAVNHSSVLGVNLKPELAMRCDELLSRLTLPQVTLTLSTAGVAKERSETTKKSPWWKFWRKTATE